MSSRHLHYHIVDMTTSLCICESSIWDATHRECVRLSVSLSWANHSNQYMRSRRSFMSRDPLNKVECIVSDLDNSPCHIRLYQVTGGVFQECDDRIDLNVKPATRCVQPPELVHSQR